MMILPNRTIHYKEYPLINSIDPTLWVMIAMEFIPG